MFQCPPWRVSMVFNVPSFAPFADLARGWFPAVAANGLPHGTRFPGRKRSPIPRKSHPSLQILPKSPCPRRRGKDFHGAAGVGSPMRLLLGASPHRGNGLQPPPMRPPFPPKPGRSTSSPSRTAISPSPAMETPFPKSVSDGIGGMDGTGWDFRRLFCPESKDFREFGRSRHGIGAPWIGPWIVLHSDVGNRRMKSSKTFPSAAYNTWSASKGLCGTSFHSGHAPKTA